MQLHTLAVHLFAINNYSCVPLECNITFIYVSGVSLVWILVSYYNNIRQWCLVWNPHWWRMSSCAKCTQNCFLSLYCYV